MELQANMLLISEAKPYNVDTDVDIHVKIKIYDPRIKGNVKLAE
jgi:hypothetical protein